MRDLYAAQLLAEAAHEGQFDKAGRPYIEHPAAVVQILHRMGADLPTLMAGWLHDVVEDTDVSLEDLRRAGFQEEVVSAVDSVTRREGEIYMDMIRRAVADPIGRIVKIADNIHNSSEERLAALPADVAEFQRRRYAKAFSVLTNGFADVDH